MRAVLVAALLALGVAGCTTLPPQPSASVPLPGASTWSLLGRISVANGEERLSGQIRWEHRAATDDILLTSPLGQGVARIVRDSAGVALEVPGRGVRRAIDAEALTRDALGYALPVQGLSAWVQARPEDARPFTQTRDGAGRVSRLIQDGWAIDYLEYSADGRPRKLALERDGLAIRLVIDQWEAAE
jgi:outer membrane lipoprotein LolB